MRFTIRDLLWLMVVVGLATAWWIDRRRITAEHAEADEETIKVLMDYQNAAVEVGYYFEHKNNGVILVKAGSSPNSIQDAPNPTTSAEP